MAKQPLFTQVFNSKLGVLYHEYAQQKTKEFMDDYDAAINRGGDHIAKEYLELIREINELGFFTRDSQDGTCDIGETLNRSSTIDHKQRGAIQGFMPHGLFNSLKEKISKEYPGKFGFVSSVDIITQRLSLTTESHSRSGEVKHTAVYPDFTETSSVYFQELWYHMYQLYKQKHTKELKPINPNLEYSYERLSYELDEDVTKYLDYILIYSIDWCKDELAADGIFTVVKDTLKRVLEEMLNAGAAAGGGGGANVGGYRRKTRSRKNKYKKRTNKKMRSKKSF